MQNFKRKEYKYYAPYILLEPLRQRFLQNMTNDPFCQGEREKLYTVRSIYFDTPHLLFYYEKLDGLKIRKKLRIRTYNNYCQDSKAFIEISY